MKKVSVANLDSGTTPDVIRTPLDPHSAIRNLNLMIGRHTGLSRCFAFIEVEDSEGDSTIAAVNAAGSSETGSLNAAARGRLERKDGIKRLATRALSAL
jgi:hypothetical protein